MEQYPEKKIAEHLDAASAALEMVMQEINEGWGPYWENMNREIGIVQQKIDRYLSDMRQLTVE